MSGRTFLVESLVYHCQYFIAMHLEEFSVSQLSLLPHYTRKDLLWQLPLADVCQLEDTKFTEGLHGYGRLLEIFLGGDVFRGDKGMA